MLRNLQFTVILNKVTWQLWLSTYSFIIPRYFIAIFSYKKMDIKITMINIRTRIVTENFIQSSLNWNNDEIKSAKLSVDKIVSMK